MISLENVLGQDRAVKYLKSSRAKGRISNGYLFVGPEGVGKSLAAKGFIAEVLCRDLKGGAACGECPSCLKMRKGQHTDVMWISSKKFKGIKIEDIRNAINYLNFKPYESRRSFCVIENAHFMTREASNALLKLLEEPPGNSLIILISSKREYLLPTVISRCSEVRFNPLSSDVIKEILLDGTDIGPEDAEMMACYSGGSAGRVLQMIDEDVVSRRASVIGSIKEFEGRKDAFLAVWRTEDKSVLLEDIDFLIMLLRDTVMEKLGLQEKVFVKKALGFEDEELFEGYSCDKIYDILTELIDVKTSVESNINPKLASPLIPGILS